MRFVLDALRTEASTLAGEGTVTFGGETLGFDVTTVAAVERLDALLRHVCAAAYRMLESVFR